ncbi:MAG: hypothetical protein JW744_04025 [Candidatus Diapherotrites archaeon]|uniref:NADH:ubiquinone oxidoreductase-like 20kDa subunit domain-containing protein n=1 Tax=Candidatus Iainarchaeum sp. TaxID=3101447 RepID=A0A939C6M5_9ARCH|nr:hypothetical protein [Candidatus Diapherotrites archaeon]
MPKKKRAGAGQKPIPKKKHSAAGKEIPMPKKKLKIGFFSLTCCEGCELAVLDLEERLLKALNYIEIADSRLLLEKPLSKKLDIAFVEGSVISKHDLDSLHSIRERSSFLVALGACATIAGIPGIRNSLPDYLQDKIKRNQIKPMKEKAFPISAFVKVDFLLQGCSINEEEFLTFLNRFLHGKTTRLEQIPVCFECKHRQNSCLLLKGIACLGPVTYAGCNALCPSENAQCIGCRGFTDDANFTALDSLFKEIGLSKEERHNLFTYFNQLPEELKEFAKENSGELPNQLKELAGENPKKKIDLEALK